MNILHIADLIGIASFALSGFLIAVRKELDLLGVILFAFLTALGGGIIRDVIIGKIPLSLKDSTPSFVVIAVIVVAIILNISQKEQLERKNVFIISDALGLVSFSISGAMIGIENGLNFFGVVILSLSTAIGGGVIRDILINEVPLILTTGFYATVSVIISISLYILNFYNSLNDLLIMSVFVLSLALRLVAYYKDWHMPKVKL